MSFLLFGFAAITTLLIAGIIVIKDKGLISGLFNWPLLLFSVMFVYILIWPILNNAPNGNLKDLLMLLGLVYCVASVVLIKKLDNEFTHLFLLIFIGGIYESLVCIGQFFAVLNSNSQWFSVTGTFPNPNITAMFLALLLPSVRIIIPSAHNKGLRLLYVLGYGLIVFAIVLLKCRTAYLGVGIGVTAYILTNRSVQNFFKRHRIYSILLLVTGIILVIPLLDKAYNFKRESADGRLLIWKVTTKMIAEKPLTGYGYGMFEKYYNQRQARYFEYETSDITERTNAQHVNMAYNEYLEIASEGGLIGLILFLGVIASLFIAFCKVPSNPVTISAVIGISVFGVMSMVNFTIQAIPVMALLVLYAAIIISYLPPSFTKFPGKITGILLVTFSLGLFNYQYRLYNALILQKEALRLLQSNRTYSAINILKSIEENLSDCESYYNLIQSAYIRQGDFVNAYQIFNKGQNYTSNNNFFLYGGFVCEQLNKSEEAAEAYNFANNMVPNLLAPKYYLMQLHLKQGREQQAKLMAEDIVNTVPKAQTDQVRAYQQAAMQLLTPLNN